MTEFCPVCGYPNCTRHPKGIDMEFGQPRPETPANDPHWIRTQSLQAIIDKYRARGDMETVAIYEGILAKYDK